MNNSIKKIFMLNHLLLIILSFVQIIVLLIFSPKRYLLIIPIYAIFLYCSIMLLLIIFNKLFPDKYNKKINKYNLLIKIFNNNK